jgi:hypothetical protein
MIRVIIDLNVVSRGEDGKGYWLSDASVSCWHDNRAMYGDDSETREYMRETWDYLFVFVPDGADPRASLGSRFSGIRDISQVKPWPLSINLEEELNG